ncbi:transglycosylase family protein [Nesterenkonia natronophila]|uniref:LysM peptidoglycan-binding domain-containing protein n=1 Tax=Nesterenkonia natronophila TaxID=2174932 RepID=A0A3A4FFU7_9MICC|nr:transglycosylase family protein [Nesterenkonia natronophila]RJN31155.1 LysM peptidoglycan-binding domain-containing protein [Nesterenkonia natronophila]
MKTTTPTWKKFVGGSVAAAALAGGAVVAQAPVANAQGDWDRLAQCESGGNWSINTGNGFYGGLQFMKATWDSMGGQQYAEYPHQASRGQQIAVATELQARYGWGQWPACSASLGLSGSPSGGGSTPAPEPEPEAPQQQEEAPQEQAPQQEEAPQEQAPQQEEAPQEQAPEPQPEPEAPQQAEQAPQEQAPAPAAEASGQANTDVQVSGEVYTIQAGDTLGSIADAVGLDWTDIWGANADQIDDPNLIFVGDQLQLPVVSG